MMFAPIPLVVTYHIAAFVVVVVWAPWWVLVAWLFLGFAVLGHVSDKRTELLLQFIPGPDSPVGIERQDLHRKVETTHATPMVSLFWPLVCLRRRGLIEQWNELVDPHAGDWRTYFRRLK